ncbi:unnamed protein product [Orchesella dallaii]|uniref:Uncharacterized protein n=1 Tax=Orchesella dallaii TaxID=48710 RepID=A0ABP1R1K9_9HEXA
MEMDEMPFPAANAILVWMSIFDKLDNDGDKIAFANASPILPDWVIDKMRPLLLSTIALLIRPYMTAKSFLGLRRVNSKTCYSIETALASYPCNLWLGFETEAQHKSKSIVPIRTTFRSSKDICRFFNQINDSNRNPFLSNSVIFVFKKNWEILQEYEETLDTESNFWRECIRLAETFGHYIEHVECEHFRAEIIAREADEERGMFFIDYGNTEIIGDLDLLGIPDELGEESRLCIFRLWEQVLAETKKKLMNCLIHVLRRRTKQSSFSI